MLKRREIREGLLNFFKKPTRKSEKIEWYIEKYITMIWTGFLGIVGFLNSPLVLGALVSLSAMIFLWVYYGLARGK